MIPANECDGSGQCKAADHVHGCYLDVEVLTITRAQLNEALAQTWDAAIASLRYADGSAVEVMSNTNPYRTPDAV